MDARQRIDLDNHITGHYGEDQFRNEPETHERFIAMTLGFYGHFGSGATKAEAEKNCRKAGGKGKRSTWTFFRFTSDLPFAPASKKVADDGEADCWVGRDGSINWIRCEREEMP